MNPNSKLHSVLSGSGLVCISIFGLAGLIALSASAQRGGGGGGGRTGRTTGGTSGTGPSRSAASASGPSRTVASGGGSSYSPSLFSDPSLAPLNVILSRNIFDSSRMPRRPVMTNNIVRTPPAAPQPQLDTIVLCGVMNYEKGPLAFFDGNNSSYYYQQPRKVNNTIADCKVTAIQADYVMLTCGSNEFRLPVGAQLTQERGSKNWRIITNVQYASSSYGSSSSSGYNSGYGSSSGFGRAGGGRNNGAAGGRNQGGLTGGRGGAGMTDLLGGLTGGGRGGRSGRGGAAADTGGAVGPDGNPVTTATPGGVFPGTDAAGSIQVGPGQYLVVPNQSSALPLPAQTTPEALQGMIERAVQERMQDYAPPPSPDDGP